MVAANFPSPVLRNKLEANAENFRKFPFGFVADRDRPEDNLLPEKLFLTEASPKDLVNEA